VRGFWHMGFTVSDLDRSIKFYQDVLGMRVDDTLDLGESQSFDKLTNNMGTRTRWAFMSLEVGGRGVRRLPASGTFTLQLVEYSAAGGEPLELAHNRPGSPHLAIFVEDAGLEFERIKDGGLAPITSEMVLHPNSRSFYIEDPDGLPIELWEEFPDEA